MRTWGIDRDVDVGWRRDELCCARGLSFFLSFFRNERRGVGAYLNHQHWRQPPEVHALCTGLVFAAAGAKHFVEFLLLCEGGKAAVQRQSPVTTLVILLRAANASNHRGRVEGGERGQSVGHWSFGVRGNEASIEVPRLRPRQLYGSRL